MPHIIHQRCHYHLQREAVARCPECRRFFCRECITEHEDKVLCAVCLQQRIKPSAKASHRFRGFFQIGQIFAGILILYLLFYYVAQFLLSLPTEFHEGTLWQGDWWKG